jgi:zinc D-Ala-D-Ala carboxypeptidase
VTPHFSLDELTVTEVRRFIGKNTPPPAVLANMRVMAEGLEAVRVVLGNRPMHVNSGYRHPALNRAVGGSDTSDHPNGWCADWTCRSFGTPLAICRAIVASGIRFDQLIEEGTWVHISFAPRLRGLILTKGRGGKLRPGLGRP